MGSYDKVSKGESLSIGGEKGHVEEVVQDPIFIALYRNFRWKKIPNCTGRYTCRDHKSVSQLTPKRFLEANDIVLERIKELTQYYVSFEEERRKDPIYVIPFADTALTGLISYVKHHDDVEGSVSYVHTLNSASGFQRKLEAIHVSLLDEYLVSGHNRETE